MWIRHLALAAAEAGKLVELRAEVDRLLGKGDKLPQMLGGCPEGNSWDDHEKVLGSKDPSNEESNTNSTSMTNSTIRALQRLQQKRRQKKKKPKLKKPSKD